jgi:hypothetical protein
MIEVVINGKAHSVDEARKIYVQLHALFGEKKYETSYKPHTSFSKDLICGGDILVKPYSSMDELAFKVEEQWGPPESLNQRDTVCTMDM